MTEPRLTRNEWRVLEIRDDCAREHHRPYRNVSSTYADPIGTWACDCGDVKWTPTFKESK